ncbi:M20/M25/M40 family metallo-hydrolase [Microbacterium sp.]|uniref:M20 family metallopeptidase n=1 Tax=Microbacterium sp. TaxID=51671 RepID=UPI002629F388|nr:M20/M25/M40 family metallo-hydrolase [Microbacterium sp.]
MTYREQTATSRERTANTAVNRDANLEERVLARIEREAVARLTEDLVRASSENPGGTEDAAARVFAAALTDAGAEVRLDDVEPGRPNLHARVGADGGEGGVLFLGHSDVVPAGVGWSGAPFAPRRDGDDLIGRGVTDMKGGLAAIAVALAAVHAEAPEVPITVLCTVDEEADARGIRHHIRHAPATRHALCVVAEPTSMTTITGCRGAANFDIEIRGHSAHAGRPSDGASAILAAADLLAVIEEDHARLAARPHPVLGAATWNVGMIEGGHGTSIVPDRCTVSIDRRTLPEEDPDVVLDALLAQTRERVRERGRPGADVIEVVGATAMTMPGFMIDPSEPVVRRIQDVVRQVGGAGDTDVWTASCEGGFVCRHHGVDTVVLGPGDLPGQAHQPDERVSISELVRAAEAFALLALRAPGWKPTEGAS